MNRIPPSERIQKQIEALLQGDWEDKEDLVTKLLMLGTQRLAQEMLEQETTDYLGRDHYKRREGDQEHRGYRNGYRPAKMDTAEGRIQLQVPQVREGGFYPGALEKGLRSERALMLALAEMYVQGVSTRKVAAITGGGGVLCGEMSRALGALGVKVAVLDLLPDAAKKVADGINEAGSHFRALLVRLMFMRQAFDTLSDRTDYYDTHPQKIQSLISAFIANESGSRHLRRVYGHLHNLRLYSPKK